MEIKSYIYTDRSWRCRDVALIKECREESTGEFGYHLFLDKPWETYRTLRGAKAAARYHGASGDWVEEATVTG